MKKILVIDDEPTIANLIVDIVGMMGYETKILTGGKEALKTAKEWKPNLITLDIMMPIPDGIEVLNQLKNDPETRQIPVFIISVVANNRQFASQLSLAEKIFEKPLDTKQLVQQIKKLVQ